MPQKRKSEETMTEDFGPTIQGIVYPDTVILPPEVLQLMPWMTLAELKVTIAAVGRLMQVGGAEPITLSEFEQLTGMSRTAVFEGIDRAMERGILTRFEVTGYQGHTSFVYEIRVFIGSKLLPMTPVKDKLSKDDVVDSELTTTSLNLTSGGAKKSQNSPENKRKNALILRLRKIGIYPKTATQLVEKNDLDRIERFLGLYSLALRTKRAAGPGWLVTAVTDPDWDPDIEQADLEARLVDIQAKAAAKESKADGAGPAPVKLPAKVTAALREIGWNGSTAEVLEAYAQNKARVLAWLKWAATQPQEYQAARFRTGLRSGQTPPAVPSQDPGRYVTGPLGKYIQH